MYVPTRRTSSTTTSDRCRARTTPRSSTKTTGNRSCWTSARPGYFANMVAACLVESVTHAAMRQPDRCAGVRGQRLYRSCRRSRSGADGRALPLPGPSDPITLIATRHHGGAVDDHKMGLAGRSDLRWERVCLVLIGCSTVTAFLL